MLAKKNNKENSNDNEESLKRLIKELRKEIQQVKKENNKYRQDTKDLIKFMVKRQMSMSSQINSLLRLQYVDLAEDNVLSHRFKIHSQNEEDGMVLYLLKKANLKQKTFVDIGCGMKGGNSGVMGFELGWRGLMIDARETAIKKISERYAHNPKMSALATFVTPENINSILKKYDLEEPAFFSLDIDSYDYWVFDAMESRPPIVALEYNALFGTNAYTVPLGGIPENAPKGYHGASLKALTRLAEKKDYRLICTDDNAINAFYLRNDIIPEIEGVDPDDAYRNKMYKFSTQDPDDQEPLQPEEHIKNYRDLGLDFVEV